MEHRSLGVTEIFGETFKLVTDCIRELAIFVAVIGGLTALGVAMNLTETSTQTFSAGFMVEEGDTLASTLFDLGLAIVSIIASYMLLTKYLAARGRLLDDRMRFWGYLGMLILSVLGIILGFILLIVPGIILLVRWSAASGFLVGEGKGVTESLGASWEATKGNSWQIFFAGILMLLAIGFAAGIINVIATLAGPMVMGFTSSFVEAASNGITLGFGIAVYTLLTDPHEQVREVFS